MWSADIIEHAHITKIKQPVKATNNQNYKEQICQHLDRLDKIRRFELVTSIDTQDISMPVVQDIWDQCYAEMDTNVDTTSLLQDNKNTVDVAPKLLKSYIATLSICQLLS